MTKPPKPVTDTTVLDEVEPLALRAPEAARAIGISERALWSLTNAGQIPHVRVGRAVVYPLRALEEWLLEQARKSTRRSSRAGAP